MALPLRCKPCRVRFNGRGFEISSNGTVRPILFNDPLLAGPALGEPLAPELAKTVRHEAARLRRNRARRERDEAMRSFGMVKTPFGWE